MSDKSGGIEPLMIFAVDGGESEYGSIIWETGKYLIEH
jgi:hypothetical protein